MMLQHPVYPYSISVLPPLLLRRVSFFYEKDQIDYITLIPHYFSKENSKAVHRVPSVLCFTWLQSPFTGYQENFARYNQYYFLKGVNKHDSLLVRLGMSDSYHDSFNVLQTQNIFISKTHAVPCNMKSLHWVSALLLTKTLWHRPQSTGKYSYMYKYSEYFFCRVKQK